MSENYFSLLNLPLSFEVNLATLEKHYFAAQREYHPDKQAGKTEAERLKAVQTSMRLNDAFETLKSPLARAQYMLELNGIFLDDSARPDTALLMEIMELREQMQEAAANKTALMPLISDTKKAMEKCNAQLSAAFDATDHETASELTLKLSYLGKAMEEAHMLLYQARAAYDTEHEHHLH